MADENNPTEGEARNVYFDWPAFTRFLFSTSGQRERIGPAWFLFLDVAQHADRAGIYTNTYERLAKQYGVAKVTVKTWRKYLRQHGVIESYSRGHAVAFRLLEPYLSFLKPIGSEKIEPNQNIEDLLALKKLLLKTVSGETIKTSM